MSCLPVFVGIFVQTKMADENVLAPDPIRSNEQILPFTAWVPIGKSNYVLDLQKKQKNPIFQLFVYILSNTNFFRAFNASAYFTLNANLLKEALEITPNDPAHLFVSPPSVNNLYQPWRAILSMINQCLTRKTSGHDRPRYPVLQMLWGIITCTNVDFAKLMWEEFMQAIQTFLTDKANLGREADEVFGMPIPNELISNNIRNAPYYSAYLERVAKHDQKVTADKEGKKESASAKPTKSKPDTDKSSKPAPTPMPKVTKEKPFKASIAKPPKPKPAKDTSTKATLLQKAGKGKATKARTLKSTLQLVNEPDEEPAHSKPESEPKHQGEGEEFDMERAIQMSMESFQAQSQAHVGGVAIQEHVAKATRPLPVVEAKGKAIVTEEQTAHSLLALHTPKRRSTTDPLIL
ncbi:hypothetical protein Tco_0468918 [Tanacetum coccineum]